MHDVTQLLAAATAGDSAAAAELLPLVYDELRRLAAAQLAAERPGQTLQATALVHEAFLRLVGGAEPRQDWPGRVYFFKAAAEAMRRILIDNARRKRRLRHGGGMHRVELDTVDPAEDTTTDQLLALDDALKQFTAQYPRAGEVVMLRYFAGCTLEEAALLLGVSFETAKKDWRFARASLFRLLRDGEETDA